MVLLRAIIEQMLYVCNWDHRSVDPYPAQSGWVGEEPAHTHRWEPWAASGCSGGAARAQLAGDITRYNAGGWATMALGFCGSDSPPDCTKERLSTADLFGQRVLSS